MLGLGLQVLSDFQEKVVWESQSAAGIPVQSFPATARLSLLFLDLRAEQDAGASGRRCFNRKETSPPPPTIHTPKAPSLPE